MKENLRKLFKELIILCYDQVSACFLFSYKCILKKKLKIMQNLNSNKKISEVFIKTDYNSFKILHLRTILYSKEKYLKKTKRIYAI